MDKVRDPVLGELSLVHAALMRGDFAALADLTRTLEKVVALAPPANDLDALRRLQRQAAENAVLLLAAQRGLRAAQRRIAEIKGVATGLTTYTAAGQRMHSAQRTGTDHRA